MADLIAGFPPEKWAAFTSDIDATQIKPDPKGNSYVRHQLCIETLNRCFGYDGWEQAVVETWTHDPYTYKTSKGEVEGRFYAEAHVRLSIGAPGTERISRENIGAQVAGGSWEEARKGAVSEGLKRCAVMFGWAPNVYKTDSLEEDWVGETIMRERQRAETAGFILPDNHQAALLAWARTVGLPEDVQRKALDLVTDKSAAWALAAVLKHLAEEGTRGTVPEPAAQLAL